MNRQGRVTGTVRTATQERARLDVNVRFASALPMVQLRGELRPGTVHLVREAFMALATARGLGHLVVLDLSGVTRCDRTSLRAVQESATLFLSVGGKELSIQGLPACVLEVID